MIDQPITNGIAQTKELTDWLLQSSIPTIRYKTRTELMGDSTAAATERTAIMHEGPVPVLLAQQLESGSWVNANNYYSPKYKSTHWTLLLLTELAVDARNKHFQQGVDYMLNASAKTIEHRLATDNFGLSCLWGNVLRYVLYAGRWGDEWVDRLIDDAVHELQRGPCYCQYNDGHACAWGAVRSLWGLAAIPPAQRTPEVNAAIEQGIVFLLDSYQLVDANYPTPDKGKVHSLWSKLSFPLFYQVDILFTLRVLAELDALDQPGAQPALQWLVRRQQQNGRWRGSNPYRTRIWPGLGDQEETNRWVSLYAATVLKQAKLR